MSHYLLAEYVDEIPTDSIVYAELTSLRKQLAIKSILEAAKSREQADRLASRNAEDAHSVAGEQLCEANVKVTALRSRLLPPAKEVKPEETTDSTGKEASVNGNELVQEGERFCGRA